MFSLNQFLAGNKKYKSTRNLMMKNGNEFPGFLVDNAGLESASRILMTGGSPNKDKSIGKQLICQKLCIIFKICCYFPKKACASR
jgi:hypothetical protein